MFKKIKMFAIPSFVLLASAQASAGTLFSKSASKMSSFGGGNFGAAYNVSASIAADENAGVMTLKSHGVLSASATLFGTTKPILKAEAHAEMVPDASASGAASCFIAGKQIYSDTFQKPLSGGPPIAFTGSKSFSAALFSGDKVFWVGPVPVKLSVALKGKVGLDYAAKVTASALSVQVKPSGEAYGTASATANLGLASAGVTANLTFLKANMPSSGALTRQNVSPLAIGYSLHADLAFSTLSGKVELWSQLAWGQKHFLTLFQIPGLSTTVPLLHENGTFM